MNIRLLKLYPYFQIHIRYGWESSCLTLQNHANIFCMRPSALQFSTTDLAKNARGKGYSNFGHGKITENKYLKILYFFGGVVPLFFIITDPQVEWWSQLAKLGIERPKLLTYISPYDPRTGK